MNSNNSKHTLLGLGLAGESLLSGGLVPFSYVSGTPFVWILSSDVTPQPSTVRGLWFDSSEWDDTKKWYD